MAQKSIYDERYKAVIGKLVSARKSLSLTQQQIADKLEKPQSYVAKYENCERRLDVIELHDICKLLKLDITQIM